MLTLALNTASSRESISLFSQKKILAECIWQGASDESEKLLSNISILLKKVHISFQDLNRIIVVKGPGPFSSVRIGVTVANTLAYALRIPLYSIDTKTLWQLRAPAKSAILLLHAGGNFIHRSGSGFREKIISIDETLDIKKENLLFFGDITQEEMRLFKKMKRKSWQFIPERRLKTFGEVIFQVKLSMLKREKIVSPLYWKPPNITTSHYVP